MKRITNKVVTFKKGAFVVVAVLLLCGAIGSGASQVEAATVAEMQAQIQSLIARINQLQLALTQRTTAGANLSCSINLTRNLSLGMTGEDVRALQRFLNRDSSTRVANVGTGSPGYESAYFGPLTKQAVIRFQEKYRSDVLAPRSLTVGTGIVDLSTRTKIHALCGAMNIGPITPVKPTPTPTPTPSWRGEEADLSHFRVLSGDDTNLEEGQRNVSVMDVRFDVRDADISIDRVDIGFEPVEGEEDRPWNTFTDIGLYVDGHKVVSTAADDRDDWDEDKPYHDAYQFRFSNLDIVVQEGERATFSIVLTLNRSIDGARDGLSWDIFIPDDGIRVRDGTTLAQAIGDESATINIDIREEGIADELAVKRSNDDPESTTLQLRDNRVSDWMTVFAFDLDTDDSDNDISIRELPISLTVSDRSVDHFMRDVRIKVNGDTYDDVDVVDGLTNSMVFNFDRDEFSIDAGDRVTVAVQVKFDALARADEGVTIYGHVDADGIEAEGTDDLDDGQLSGASTGDTHILRTNGVILKSVDTSDRTVGSNDTLGRFDVKFAVTAFEGDFYVSPHVTNTMSTSSGGVKYSIEGEDAFVGSASGVLSSTARETSDRVFIVRNGKTETFTLTLTIDPDVSGWYRMALNKLYFTEVPDGVSDLIEYIPVPASEYRTGYTYVLGG